jgi:hypothetical protein
MNQPQKPNSNNGKNGKILDHKYGKILKTKSGSGLIKYSKNTTQ